MWIEKIKEEHEHDGKGWEYGKCLWGPTTGKTGKKILVIKY